MDDAKDTDSSWIYLGTGQGNGQGHIHELETMQDRIIRVTTDQKNLENFYNLRISRTRTDRMRKFYSDELEDLHRVSFDRYSQQEKVDYLLLQNFLRRGRHVLELDAARDEKMGPLLPFASAVIDACEMRQRMIPVEARQAASSLNEITKSVIKTLGSVQKDEIKIDATTAYRAAKSVQQLRLHLSEYYSFHHTYNPMFDWWCTAPWQEADQALGQLSPAIQTKLAGLNGADDEIVGEPIGRDGLLTELEAELIPYTPEELIRLAKKEYEWCEKEMKKASENLSFGSDWKKVLEYVKTLHVDPGEQTELARHLGVEGTQYVTRHDLVTVPTVASETWRMYTMSEELQKIAPFFLGGSTIQVAYPTVNMSHDDKMMVMRGNNRHFSRATAFHELIPGHRLQLFMGSRHRPYRQLFSTPFFVEGWAMYWEMVFWDRGDFFVSPEDKVGTMFWRMHRCARVIFSLKFHLGEMTPQECIDLLVNWVGHERSTAEGEVRRSLNGDYGPLYQAGYLLGATQIHELRKEILGQGLMVEKDFHDTVLKSNTMPIELLRALLINQELTPDFSSKWKFYGDKI